jgi:hypothetical protein
MCHCHQHETAHAGYDEYLANGWPIASGPIEGARKHLMKDWIERSGVRRRYPAVWSVVPK